MINDPKLEYGIDFNSPKTISSYFDFLKTPREYGSFIGFEYGYDYKVRALFELMVAEHIRLKDP